MGTLICNTNTRETEAVQAQRDTSETVEWIKVSAAKSRGLSLVPETHPVGEPTPASCLLTSTSAYMCYKEKCKTNITNPHTWEAEKGPPSSRSEVSLGYKVSTQGPHSPFLKTKPTRNQAQKQTSKQVHLIQFLNTCRNFMGLLRCPQQPRGTTSNLVLCSRKENNITYDRAGTQKVVSRWKTQANTG